MCRISPVTKRGPFEIEDSVDDVADFAHPAEEANVIHALIGCRSYIGVLTTPRETAFTLTPREAYSMASDRVEK